MIIKDTIQRSFLKGVTWRVVAGIDTFIISFVITGDSVIAGSISVIEIITKVLLYFLHERLWNMILWGREFDKVRPLRSMLKSISWRLWGTIDTMIITYILTGELVYSLSIGSIEVFTKILLYFVHERIWATIKWGRLVIKTVSE